MRCIASKLIYVDGYGAVDVPCGKCLACLSNKRNEWIFRLEQEYKHAKSALFVTLTYDEKHYPGGLRKKDLQLYIKRLRKRDGTNSIRYYGVGEFGTKYGRAHYHLLIFNASEKDVRLSWCDSRQKSIGLVHCGQVTQASIAYCTKYIVQRDDGGGKGSASGGLSEEQRPFAVMSRAYGIGGRYLSQNMVDWHRENRSCLAVDRDKKIALPRFYSSKIWYSKVDRESIGAKKKEEGKKEEERVVDWFAKRYGLDGPAKYVEMRDAMLSRIKSKVSYTQTL